MHPYSADVRSIEALEDLHAELCKFRTAAQDALSSIELSIRRGVDYLHEKSQFWQRTIRTCEDEVFQAKQELSTRKFPTWDGRKPDTTVQEENLKIAQRRLQHARDKAEVTRRWITKYPNLVSEVYAAPSKHLGATLEGELPRGLAVLERRIQSLEAYAALAPPAAQTETPAPAAAPEAEKRP
jgi:hypothetical protein